MEQLIEDIQPIKDFEDLYEISNYGYIISLAKTWIAGNGVNLVKPTTIMKTSLSKGYERTILCKNKQQKQVFVHQLVWDHFGDKLRDNKLFQIDHKDENKLNNRIDNLQLITQRQNIAKSYKNKSKSSFTGVTQDNRTKRWRSRMWVNGKNIHLGMFDKETDASNAYQNKLKELNYVRH